MWLELLYVIFVLDYVQKLNDDSHGYENETLIELQPFAIHKSFFHH